MGRHLTFKDRKKIEKLAAANESASRIAEAVGCSRLTIYNEMRRGGATKEEGKRSSYSGYSAERAQALCEELRQHSNAKPLRIEGHEEILTKIAGWVREGKSAQACSDLIAEEYGGLRIARSTVYKYIRTGIIPGITPADLAKNKRRKVV